MTMFRTFYTYLTGTPEPELAPLPEPEPVDPYRVLIDGMVQHSMVAAKLDAATKKAVDALVVEQATVLAEHYLYDTPEGREMLRGLEAAMRRYPVVASDIEAQLASALSQVVLDHFQKERM